MIKATSIAETQITRQTMMRRVEQVLLFLTVLNLMGFNTGVTSPGEEMSTGPCCPASPAGVPGIPGHPGPYGPVGSKGDMGSPGDAGMHGAKGDKGSDGLNGERGATGEPGQKGEQGIGQPGKQGPQGLRGIAGLMGERGVPGTFGIQGVNGSKGDMGSPGDVGIRGAKGIKGSRGLKGDRGATGVPGQKGEQGVGQQGRQGVQGQTGRIGVKGERGLKGQRGECAECNQRVAFSVAGWDTPLQLQAKSRLPFQEILFQVGTEFHLRTGTFTCNVPGIYVFMFSILKSNDVFITNVSLVKNDIIIVSEYTVDSVNAMTLHTGNTAVLSLQQGDQIFLQAEGRMRGVGYYESYFSGFLLYGDN